MTWKTETCYNSHKFVCARKKETTRAKGFIPCPTKSTGYPGWDEWYSQTGNTEDPCFRIPSTSRYYQGYARQMSFENAERFCRDDNATLASIHGPDEAQFILKLATKIDDTYTYSKISRLLIGLNTLTSSAPQWTDGTAFDYRVFSRNMRTGSDRQFCYSIIMDEKSGEAGKWMDVNCDASLPFVCKVSGRLSMP